MQAMNDAMNMSLDEYIALNKLKNKNTDKNTGNRNTNGFKTRFRSDTNDDQSDDDDKPSCSDIAMEEPIENQKSKSSEKIWKGPSSHTDFLEFNYMCDDFNTVYKEIVGENGSQDLPPANSIQWRIDPVNINRPVGMAPLIPRNVPKQQQRISNNKGNIIHRQQFKNRNYPNRYRNHNSQSQRNNNFNRQQNKNFNLNPRFNNNNNTPRNTVQLNTVSKLRQNFGNQNDAIRSNNNDAIDNLAIKNNFNPETNIFAFNAKTSDNQPNQDSLVRSNQVDESLGKLSLASIFNVDNNNVAQRNLGAMAGKFLEFLSNYENTVHKPVYDMDVQQEIAKLQNKNLVCTNSGTIVSKEGTGVDCKIIPKTTSMSLNIRYC